MADSKIDIQITSESTTEQMKDAIERITCLVEADRTFNDIREILRTALKTPTDEYGPYIDDISSDYVIYEQGNKLYKSNYTIDDKNIVTFGDAIEVVQKTVYEVVESAKPTQTKIKFQEKGQLIGNIIPLVESKVHDDGTIPIKIIEPGWGDSGYYSEEVLKRDAGIYEAGTKMYWDHPTITDDQERPERSLINFAGVLVTEGKYKEDGSQGAGVYATAMVFPEYRETLNAKAPYIGLSHIAYGKAEYGEIEGKSGRIVESLKTAASVDFVTTAGAGGMITELFESSRNKIKTDMADENKELDKLKESNTNLETEKARFRERLLTYEARDLGNTELREVDLSEATKKRILESLVKNPVTDDKGDIDKLKFIEAVKAKVTEEIAYIAELTESGKIKNMGGSEIIEDDKLQESMEVDFNRLMGDDKLSKIAAVGR